MLDKLYQSVKKNASEIETCAKSIVHHLEFKIQSKVSEGVGEEMQAKQIMGFCAESQSTIKDCADTLAKYEELLTGVNNIELPEFRISREACIKTEALVLNPELKDITHFVTNLTL